MMIALLGAGFEEIEALAAVDILRRAGLEVRTAGIGSCSIKGSHGITVQTDMDIEETDDFPDLLILPGGRGGVQTIESSPIAMKMIERQIMENRSLAAICAAPSILGKRGWIDGRNATCHPDFESQMGQAKLMHLPVVTDENLITGRAAGASILFALTIVERFCGTEMRNKLENDMVWHD